MESGCRQRGAVKPRWGKKRRGFLRAVFSFRKHVPYSHMPVRRSHTAQKALYRLKQTRAVQPRNPTSYCMNCNRVRHRPNRRRMKRGRQPVRRYTSRDLWLMILKAASPNYQLAGANQPGDCFAREQLKSSMQGYRGRRQGRGGFRHHP